MSVFAGNAENRQIYRERERMSSWPGLGLELGEVTANTVKTVFLFGLVKTF